jgi:CheY-like chemotaxis protein
LRKEDEALTTPRSSAPGPAALLPVLIAEDEAVSRLFLEATLRRWGHEVVVTVDGDAVWAALQRSDAPSIAILDRAMHEARTEQPHKP